MSTTVSQIFKSNLIGEILTYFLVHASSQVYVKELARRLKVGPTSANNALRTLSGADLLHRQEMARSHFYSLNNESVIVKLLKAAYFLARLQDIEFVNKLLELDEGLISLCIYGSFADGTFDEKSDLDILIISQKGRSIFNSLVTKFEGSLGLEINAEVFNLSKWKCLKEKDKGFYQEIVGSHILLYGSELI